MDADLALARAPGLTPALADQIAKLRADFARDGAVCVRAAFTTRWLETLTAGLERNMREPGPSAKDYTPAGSPGRFFGDYCNWRRIPEYADFLLHSPAAAIAGGLMGSRKVNLFHEHVLVKEPGTLEPTPWHHDQPYWTIDGAEVCSLWLSVDPVPRDSGVEYVAGSHRWGSWFTPRRFADAQDHAAADGFVPVPDIDGHRDDYTLLGWDLEPGDCVVFHALTLHGAPGNRAGSRRRAVASRWAGDDATYVLRSGFMSPPPMLFPGAPPPGGPLDSAAFPVVWRAA